jgi:hypothetical protein
MKSIVTGAGQSIASLASIHLKDPTYFRAIAEENDWNPIADSPLPLNIAAKIPTLSEIAPLAQSKLAQAENTVAAIKGKVQQVGGLTGQVSGQVANTINSLDKSLPTQYRGYTKIALDAIADVNGAIGEVESTLVSTLDKFDKSISNARKYSDERVRLVNWLLS